MVVVVILDLDDIFDLADNDPWFGHSHAVWRFRFEDACTFRTRGSLE